MDRCVSSFYSKTLNDAEKRCLDTCVDKNVKHMQRIKMRFEEQTMQQMTEMQQQK